MSVPSSIIVPHVSQITDTVYPMYKAFIEPDLQQAQLVVVNHFNPFSGFMNPIYILKSQQAVDRSLVQNVLEVSSRDGLLSVQRVDGFSWLAMDEWIGTLGHWDVTRMC